MIRPNLRPPLTARKLLAFFKSYDEEYALSIELEKEFQILVQEKGRFRASIWYWVQLLHAVFVYLRRLFRSGAAMLLNYLKVTLRQIKRHKIYSLINITGLALGITCCILVLLFVQEEYSFDRFHEKADNIFRIAEDIQRPAEVFHSVRVASWIGPGLKDNFPEVLNAVRIVRWAGKVSWQDKRFDERLFYADPSFNKIFTFPLTEGNIKSALSFPNSVIISRQLANKYFGDQSAIGQVLTVDGEYDFTVTGVLADIPRNSHIKFDFLAHFDHVRNIYGEERFQKNRVMAYTYLELNDPDSTSQIEDKLPGFLSKQKGDEYAAMRSLSLLPLTSIHFHSHSGVELSKNSKASFSYYLTGIALLILIIACINYINLSTARAAKRSLEVGVRKVLGADRRRLFQQFVGESMIFAFIAAVIALILAWLFLPVFNSLLARDLVMDIDSNALLWLGISGLVFLVGGLSGSYPALLLASLRLSEILKRKVFKNSMTGLLLRKGLVVFQISLAVIFIIGTLVVSRQLDFIQNKNLGFDKDNVLILPPPLKLASGYLGFKSELLAHPGILEVTASTGMPGRYPGIPFSFIPEGGTKAESVLLDYTAIDFDYFTFYGLQLLNGRSFSRSASSDTRQTFILNEAAVKKLGWEEPIGRRLVEVREGIKGEIIGVVRDFHNVSLHDQIQPAIYQVETQMLGQVAVRFVPPREKEVISFLEAKWLEWAPNNIFYFSYLDDDLTALYQSDQKAGQVFEMAAVLTVFIACLGLLGLSVYTAEQRIKEIGIRKTLGASVSGIVKLLSKDFLILGIVANLIAWPVIYYIMHLWLKNFVYHTSIPFWLFVLGSGLAAAASMSTVGFQALKAARSDPVKSLRYE